MEPGNSWKSIVVLLVCILVILVAMLGTGVVLSQGASKEDHVTIRSLYTGEVETATAVYSAEVVEEHRVSGSRLIVHLWYSNGVLMNGITGHDYDGDRKWDVVFYCGPHRLIDPDNMGCGSSSIYRTSIGTSFGFHPDPDDSSKVAPFSREAISFALVELDVALNHIFNDEHMEKQWVWDEEIHDEVLSFDRSQPVKSANQPQT